MREEMSIAALAAASVFMVACGTVEEEDAGDERIEERASIQEDLKRLNGGEFDQNGRVLGTLQPFEPAAGYFFTSESRSIMARNESVVDVPLDDILFGAPGPDAARSQRGGLWNHPAVPGGSVRPPAAQPEVGMEFADPGRNSECDPAVEPLSTFAADVDTASWSICRRLLRAGHRPPAAAVRIEEFANAFDYGYDAPEEGPFALHIEGARSPRGDDHLLRVAVQGQRIEPGARKPAVLTLVVDVSGSMQERGKLDLVERALVALAGATDGRDRLAIVAYSDEARVVLPHTTADRRAEIVSAVESLVAEGSTNLEAGLALGYRLALENFVPGCTNRVLLFSDGVANVEASNFAAVLATVKDAVDDGVTLSCLGVGMGSYNDEMMEGLADTGDGNYAYLDTAREAQRVLVGELVGTIELLARDARVQVEFDPAAVASYRLLGYENRALSEQEFRDDRRDAGEIGVGHAVTAVYRVRLREGIEGKVATARFRWQDPQSGQWRELERAIALGEIERPFEGASRAFRLAAAVVSFAETLRAGGATPEFLPALARALASERPGDLESSELAELVSIGAGSLDS